MGQLTRVAEGSGGSGPGRMRLTVTETSGYNILGLVAALRSRNYDPAATAAPFYQAENLSPVSPAAVVGTAVRHSNLASSWTPVLDLKLGSSYLTHRGGYRLWAWVMNKSATAVKARVVWDVSDLVLPVENDEDLKEIPSDAKNHLVDLGELRLDPTGVGVHRWAGQIQAKGAMGGEIFEVDAVAFMCFDEGYAKLRAPQLDTTASVAAYGPRNPNSVVDAAGVGTVAWSNPGLAASSNNLWATATINSGQVSHYLKATNYGFSIPTGATINGIKVDVERMGESYPPVDYAVRIVKGGTIGGTDRSAGAWPAAVEAVKTYGGATDLWGQTWTPADINSSTFGFAIAADYKDLAYTIGYVDTIAITVYYTPASTVIQDAVIYANQSAELSWRGHFREDSTGTASGPISEPQSDNLRLPAAGSEGRPTEITVLTSRGDLESLPDTGGDTFTVDGVVAPTWLFPPGG